MLEEYLLKEKEVKLLVMCPLRENIQAIVCYKNCGFKINHYFKTNDTIGYLKEYVLMTKEEK